MKKYLPSILVIIAFAVGLFQGYYHSSVACAGGYEHEHEDEHEHYTPPPEECTPTSTPPIVPPEPTSTPPIVEPSSTPPIVIPPSEPSSTPTSTPPVDEPPTTTGGGGGGGGGSDTPPPIVIVGGGSNGGGGTGYYLPPYQPTANPTSTIPTIQTTFCEKITNFVVDIGTPKDGKVFLSWSGGNATSLIRYGETTSLDWWTEVVGNSVEIGNLNLVNHWFQVENQCSKSEMIDPAP